MAEIPLPLGEPVDDATPRPRPPHRPLEGSTYDLVPLDVERHGAALFDASHGDPRVERMWTYLPAGPFGSAAELGAWYRATGAAGDPQFYALIERASGRPQGVTSYLAMRPEHGVLEIGHVWCAPAIQRGTANTEANALLLREAFDGLGYRRVEWKCDAKNAASRAAALRLGFQYEGLFRQHLITRGRNRDTAWFAMLDVDWPDARSALERWLGWDERQGPRPSLASLR